MKLRESCCLQVGTGYSIQEALQSDVGSYSGCHLTLFDSEPASGVQTALGS